MKVKLDIKLLEKLSIENLERVKSEAELNLNDLSCSEDIIINKSNTLFQVLIVIFTTIIGYLVSQINSFELKSVLIQISFIFCLIFVFVLYLLLKVIYPNKIALKGSAPHNLVHESLFNRKSDKSHSTAILRSRIYSLSIAIENNRENLRNRVKLFDYANKSILFGLIIGLIYSMIYFLITSSCLSVLST